MTNADVFEFHLAQLRLKSNGSTLVVLNMSEFFLNNIILTIVLLSH